MFERCAIGLMEPVFFFVCLVTYLPVLIFGHLQAKSDAGTNIETGPFRILEPGDFLYIRSTCIMNLTHPFVCSSSSPSSLDNTFPIIAASGILN